MKADEYRNIGGKLTIISEALSAHDVDAFMNLLRSVGEKRISPSHFRDLVMNDREHLIFSLLCELGIVVSASEYGEAVYGHLNLGALGWLEERLHLTMGVINSFHEKQYGSAESFQELAWTLPSDLYENIDHLPARQSLAALTKYAISLAQEKLVLVSPFLDEAGAKLLAIALEGTAKRGVRVSLISHGLNESDDHVKRILDVYRNASPKIQFLTAPSPKSTTPYLLLHAKLIIADVKYAVLSTANLTQYGLGSHLEVGVGLTGKPVRQLDQLITNLLSSKLISEVQ